MIPFSWKRTTNHVRSFKLRVIGVEQLRWAKPTCRVDPVLAVDRHGSITRRHAILRERRDPEPERVVNFASGGVDCGDGGPSEPVCLDRAGGNQPR